MSDLVKIPGIQEFNEPREDSPVQNSLFGTDECSRISAPVRCRAFPGNRGLHLSGRFTGRCNDRCAGSTERIRAQNSYPRRGARGAGSAG